jgi:hypothetical protein
MHCEAHSSTGCRIIVSDKLGGHGAMKTAQNANGSDPLLLALLICAILL